MDAIIEVEGLLKKYNKTLALNDVTFKLFRGNIYGLIGPNGSGKTTLMKLLCGIIKPTKGVIKIFGSNYSNPHNRLKIGYISENNGLYQYMNAKSYLHYYGRNYPTILDDPCIESSKKNLISIRNDDIKTEKIQYLESQNTNYLTDTSNSLSCRIAELIKKVGLEPHEDKKISSYSKGMKQRLGIARMLIHNPELLICDEPLSGLDTIGKFMLFELFNEIRNLGKTIIISSHELKEIEQICNEVILIKDGKIIAMGNPNEIYNLQSNRELILTFNLNSIQPSIAEILNSIKEIIDFSLSGPVLKLRVDNIKGIEKIILHKLLEENIDFSLQTGKLDSLYINMVG